MLTHGQTARLLDVRPRRAAGDEGLRVDQPGACLVRRVRLPARILLRPAPDCPLVGDVRPRDHLQRLQRAVCRLHRRVRRRAQPGCPHRLSILCRIGGQRASDDRCGLDFGYD